MMGGGVGGGGLPEQRAQVRLLSMLGDADVQATVVLS